MKGNNKKNRIISEISLWIPVLIICGIIFYSGYFIGKEYSVNINSANAISSHLNSIGKLDEHDLTPFWKTWNLINQKYISSSGDDTVTKDDLIYGAISGMVNALGDPYTVFLRPEAKASFTESITGNFSGVGMEVGMEDEKLIVIAPLKNTPAEKAGIISGDVIIEIDGESTRGMDLTTAVGKIRGEVGTVVVITVLREGLNTPIEISITRAVIDIPTLDYELMDNGVFKISLYNFGANSAADFRNALRNFIASDSSMLLLDLRGNPGGFLESSIDMASWFLAAGKVVVQEDFGNDNIKLLRSRGQTILHPNFKMVILVNKGSASASEILAGALQEHGVATLVGTKTFGKGSVQELIDINDETALKVTIARWLTPNGVSISEGGLTPNIIVDKYPEALRESDWDQLTDFEKLRKLYDYQESVAIEILKDK